MMHLFRTYGSFLCVLILLAMQSLCLAQTPESTADSIIQSLELEKLENDSLRIDRMLDASLEYVNSDFLVAKAIILKTLEKAMRDSSARDVSGVNFILGSYYAIEGEDSLSTDAFTKTLTFLQQQKDTANMLSISFNMLNAKYENGYDDLVIREADSLIVIAGLINRPRFVALFQELKSSALRSLYQNRLAIQTLLKSIAYFEETADSARLGSAYENLALSHWDLEKHEDAQRYFRQAFSYYTAFDDLYYMAGTWIHLGEMFIIQEQYDSAQYYLEKSLPVNEENQFSLLAKSYAGLSIVYEKQGRMREAQSYFLKAKEAFVDQGNTSSLSRLYVDWGKSWLAKNQINKAHQLLMEGLKQIEESKIGAEAPIFWGPLAEAYTQMGDWRNAAVYWEKYARQGEIQFETESVRQQQELVILYETEKKERELLEKQKENDDLLNQSRIQTLNLQRLWIGSGLLLSLGLLGFVLYRQRTIRTRLAQEQEKKALELELEFKHRELTTHTLHLVSKNKLLAELKGGLESLKGDEGQTSPVNPLIGAIDRDLKDDTDWENFERYFKQVYSGFDEKMKRAFPTLTGNEIRLVTLMKMNLSTKEIASILNVTPESVNKARYRLRKKTNLSSDQNLQDFILAM